MANQRISHLHRCVLRDFPLNAKPQRLCICGFTSSPSLLSSGHPQSCASMEQVHWEAGRQRRKMSTVYFHQHQYTNVQTQTADPFPAILQCFYEPGTHLVPQTNRGTDTQHRYEMWIILKFNHILHIWNHQKSNGYKSLRFGDRPCSVPKFRYRLVSQEMLTYRKAVVQFPLPLVRSVDECVPFLGQLVHLSANTSGKFASLFLGAPVPARISLQFPPRWKQNHKITVKHQYKC